MPALITDPWFYAVAVPAVLLMGLAKSGFLMGFGSLATPLLALVLPAPQAAALMLPLLLAMDATGVRQLWRERDRELLRLLLPASLIGTVVGTLLFGLLQGKTVAAVVGGLTLLFLAQRLAFPPRSDSAPPSRAVGFLLGIAGGFTSFVAHAGGPPIAAYVLPLRLAPLRLAATLAVLFGFINLSKWIPYAAPGPVRRPHPAHLAGADAVGTAGCLARHLGHPAHRLGLVLPHRLRRHVPDRGQAVVGWAAVAALTARRDPARHAVSQRRLARSRPRPDGRPRRPSACGCPCAHARRP